MDDISVESEYSKTLYEINKEYLKCSQQLLNVKRKSLSLSNFKILFSYVRSGAFNRIVRRLKISKGNNTGSNFMIKNYKSYPKAKVVVYTCIWGKYDNVLEPYFINDEIDYCIITDQDIPANSKWKKIELPKNIDFSIMTPIEINRFCKMLPHKLFSDYDYSIYIDGNIRIVCDLFPIIADMGDKTIGIHDYQVDCIYNMKNAIIAGKKAPRSLVNKQIKKYKKDGFPKHFGAFECNVLVRKHNDNTCKKIMDDWWDEFNSTSSKRDQLSLPYVIWKNGHDSSIVFSLGNSVFLNPRFQVTGKHLK